MGRNRRTLALAAIVASLLASLALHLWGVERNLPDARDVDEDFLFRPAMDIVATGNLNPGWFGYPASTVIYPLAALLHVQQAACHGGRWLAAHAKLRFEFYAGDFAHYVRTGRYLSIAYGVASVGLAAWIAWACFGPGTAVVAIVLATCSPVAVEYAQTLRSDSAATFFGLAFLAFALRTCAAPTVSRQALAGAALGLAIASRYMMASTGLVLAAMHLRMLRSTELPRRPLLRGMVAAWLAVAVAFFVATPYMLLDAGKALHGLAVAAAKQSVHVGIDQLGFAGNLGFYFGEAIPQAIGWGQYGLALLAFAAAPWRRRSALPWLQLYVASFVLGVSLLGIHWQRWAMPVLPVLAVLAAWTLVATAGWITRGRRQPVASLVASGAVAAVTLLVVWTPAAETIDNARHNAKPSTEIAALDWVLANVPDGSRIAFEWYSAPLKAKRANAKRFELLPLGALANRPLESYRRDRWEYMLVSTSMYGRYTRDPENHPVEVEFYRRLRESGTLLYEVGPSDERRGPLVSIFRLPPDAPVTGPAS